MQPAAIVQREREILHDKIDAAAAAARASEEKEIYIVIFHEIAWRAITGTVGKRKSRRQKPRGKARGYRSRLLDFWLGVLAKNSER